ncbi:hypothetical protein [Neobacillus cucumis]|nr:hypothetical protein [Neobacillus cucumis]
MKELRLLVGSTKFPNIRRWADRICYQQKRRLYGATLSLSKWRC